jgi:hypothetical protein
MVGWDRSAERGAVSAAFRGLGLSWVPHWPGGPPSFASMGRPPASLLSPIGCLGCMLAVCGATPWSAAASPSSHFLSFVHAVAFHIVCENLAPGVGLPSFLCATPWVSMAALRSLFAILVSN